MIDAASDRMLGPWSGTGGALVWRLSIELEEIDGGLRHAVFVEAKNVALDPVALIDQPAVSVTVRDAAGHEPASVVLPASGPHHAAQWAVIPRDGYVGIRIDGRLVGMPARDQGKALLALGDRSWVLGAGSYVLALQVSFPVDAKGPANQWSGRIVFPPLAFSVTPNRPEPG